MAENVLFPFIEALNRARVDLASSSESVPEKELRALASAAIGVMDSLPEAPELTADEKREFAQTLCEFLPVLELGLKGEWPDLRPVVLGFVAVAIDRIVNALGNSLMASLKDE